MKYRKFTILIVFMLIALSSFQRADACSLPLHTSPYLSNLRTTENPGLLLAELRNSYQDDTEEVYLNLTGQHLYQLQTCQSDIEEVTVSPLNITDIPYQTNIEVNGSEIKWLVTNETDVIVNTTVMLPSNQTVLNIGEDEAHYYYWAFVSLKLNNAYLIVHVDEISEDRLFITQLNDTEMYTSVIVDGWDSYSSIYNVTVYDDDQVIYQEAGCCYCIYGTYYKFTESNLEKLYSPGIHGSVVDTRTNMIVSVEYRENAIALVKTVNYITLEREEWNLSLSEISKDPIECASDKLGSHFLGTMISSFIGIGTISVLQKQRKSKKTI